MDTLKILKFLKHKGEVDPLKALEEMNGQA